MDSTIITTTEFIHQTDFILTFTKTNDEIGHLYHYLPFTTYLHYHSIIQSTMITTTMITITMITITLLYF